jgi:hypothetical protein
MLGQRQSTGRQGQGSGCSNEGLIQSENGYAFEALAEKLGWRPLFAISGDMPSFVNVRCRG